MSLDLQNAVGRQYPLVALQHFTYEDLGGVAVAALDLPGGAIVIGGELVITEAFNSATSDAIDVGDGADPDRYAAAVDAQALGRTALTLTGYKYALPDTVDIGLTSVGGPPTAGGGYLMVEYIMDGRSQEVQPASA